MIVTAMSVEQDAQVPVPKTPMSTSGMSVATTPAALSEAGPDGSATSLNTLSCPLLCFYTLNLEYIIQHDALLLMRFPLPMPTTTALPWRRTDPLHRALPAI